MPKILLALIILLNIALYAEEVPYKIDIIRNGKAHHQVAYNFWSGEYPSPVINVHAGKNGKTTIEGYVSMRDKKERKICTIKNGLYHPWSKDKNSYINFYTIVPVESYEVISTPANDLAEKSLKTGDKIINIVYLGEGESQGILQSNSNEDTLIYFQSQIFENNPKIFKSIENISTYNNDEQWLYLKCDERYNVFVEDKDILSQKGIKKGQITSYGEISK
ncbi:MAG: hypothetical protein PHI02_06660 [Sulfurovaceae bacterium]|nr:hypothetical protein [Sulfurovaceae bacterium]